MSSVSVDVEDVYVGSDGEVEETVFEEHSSTLRGPLITGVVRRNSRYQNHTITADSKVQKRSSCAPREKSPNQSKERTLSPDVLCYVSGRLTALKIRDDSALPQSKKRASTHGVSSNGEVGKATSVQKPLFFKGLTQKCHSSHQKHAVNERPGAYGKFLLGAANELAGRALLDRLSVPCAGPKKDHQRTGGASAVSCNAGSFSASTPLSMSASALPLRVKGKTAAVNCGHGGGSEVTATTDAVVRPRSVSPSLGARRVVHQTGPIERTKERRTFTEHGERKSVCCRCRVIKADDSLWKRERDNRKSSSDEEEAAKMDSVGFFHVLTETPKFPAALESALANHHLALLAKCKRDEMDRVVAMFIPLDRFEVLRHLRLTYGRPHSSGALSSTSHQSRRMPSSHREEIPATRRPQLSTNMRSVAGRNGTLADTNENAAPLPKPVRHFIKCFTREVCMAFLDEACTLCAARCGCALAERSWNKDQQEEENEEEKEEENEEEKEEENEEEKEEEKDEEEEGNKDGMQSSDGVVEALYGQVVTELLFDMLKWTKEESSSVVQPVVLHIMQHLSSCAS